MTFLWKSLRIHLALNWSRPITWTTIARVTRPSLRILMISSTWNTRLIIARSTHRLDQSARLVAPVTRLQKVSTVAICSAVAEVTTRVEYSLLNRASALSSGAARSNVKPVPNGRMNISANLCNRLNWTKLYQAAVVVTASAPAIILISISAIYPQLQMNNSFKCFFFFIYSLTNKIQMQNRLFKYIVSPESMQSVLDYVNKFFVVG